MQDLIDSHNYLLLSDTSFSQHLHSHQIVRVFPSILVTSFVLHFSSSVFYTSVLFFLQTHVIRRYWSYDARAFHEPRCLSGGGFLQHMEGLLVLISGLNI